MGKMAEWLSGKTVSCSLGIPLQLAKNAHILEVGYGSGNWLLTMAQLGYTNLHGYDLETNSENKNRLIDTGIDVSSGDFISNDYPENHYDCIRLEHVFEHLLDKCQHF